MKGKFVFCYLSVVLFDIISFGLFEPGYIITKLNELTNKKIVRQTDIVESRESLGKIYSQGFRRVILFRVHR